MAAETYSQTVKPYLEDYHPTDADKAMARNRLHGNWLAASTGDVSDVEVVSIVVHPDGSATITYALSGP